MTPVMRAAAGVLAAACASLAIAEPAFAAETVTYTYDARGRLVEVNHTTGLHAGVKTEYTWDENGNMKRRKTTGS